MTRVLLLLLGLVGCGGPPSPPSVQCVDIGVAEDAFPLRLAVIVQNDGDKPVTITDADVAFDWQELLLLDDTPVDPFRFAHTVRIPPPGPPLQPGERQTVAVDVVWEPPTEAPILALVHTAGVTVTLHDTLVIQSQPATLLLRGSEDTPTSVTLSPKLVEKVRKAPGWKAPAVMRLLSDTPSI